MARAIALASSRRPELVEALRMLVVCGCALAVILAGPALPNF